MDPSTVTIDALIGLGMPGVIALVNQAHWSPRVKGVVAFALCVVAAGVTELLRGNTHDWTDWRTTFVVVFGAAIVSYRMWWQPSLIAPTLESVTSREHVEVR